MGGNPEEQGTWLHPKLAIDFARWLSAEFAVWCDEQIEKILHPAIKPAEPTPEKPTKKSLPNGLTLEQQDSIKALVKARVDTLPADKRAKGAITLWSSLKSKFGCTYKEIEPENFTAALSLVARVALEGEYIPKGEPEPAPKVEQQAPEYITANDENNIKRVVWDICRGKHFEKSWSFAVWAALRARTGCKAPQRFEVQHLPEIADELKRILETTTKLDAYEDKLEKAVLKSIRNGGDLGAVISEEESAHSETLKEITDTINASLGGWRLRELSAIPLRAVSPCAA